jgi:hypothetical protein
LATWLVIEQPGGQALYDVERNGRAFAYDLGLDRAQDRIQKNRRFDPSADKIVLVTADGGREVVPLRQPSPKK